MVADLGSNSWVPVTLASVSTSAPASPAPGALWLDVGANTLKVWDGVSWIALINADDAIMTSDLDMSNNKIVNLANPTNPTDALNLQTGDVRYVNVSGDTMTGSLNLGANRLNFSNMFLNEGNGNNAVGPDIRFNTAGLITADTSVYVIVDDNNAGSGNFVVSKGAENTSASTALMTVYNTGEIRSNIASYDTLVINNNTLTNKKYVDDAIQSIPGKQTISIPASALRPRGTNGCAFLATINGGTNQPDIDMLAYDGDVVEYSKISVAMPVSWDEGPITARFQWKRASGTSAASVVWGVRAVALNDGASITSTFNSATVTVAAKTSPTVVSISGETAPLLIAGSPQPGTLVMFEFFRLSTDANDTMAGEDAQLISVQVHYTTNVNNDA